MSSQPDLKRNLWHAQQTKENQMHKNQRYYTIEKQCNADKKPKQPKKKKQELENEENCKILSHYSGSILYLSYFA